ncbi:BRCT domain-containing protein [Fusarium falciforme]|uniref:BRCT domain-containing protein n=1 Tax=Fusarium falciforme TaxID=195108 RepID=UPI002301C85A|nr:BRCT domain-containing protein [Fusarium falciforme]WAO92845.1 BRCT domain-containing protein [Fusarium falciforme]
MPPQIFKGRVLAAAGPLPGQLTVENLKRWALIRNGDFVDHFDEDVTHLLCTREQFDKRVPRVKDALKRGKRFHIVHCDWFEFSAVKNKRLPEKEFSMRNILAKQNAKRRERARIEKGKRDGEKFVNTNFYHIYRDRSNFAYQLDISRDDEAAGEFGQKYTLCLWESNAKPHLYWFTAKFTKRKGNSQPTYHRPSVCPDKWRPQMDLFMEFFRVKTGIPWEDRVTLAMTMPSSYFQYEPPTGGKPSGRRLRFDSEYCQQINAELRGLPWPPVEEAEVETPKEVHDSEPILEYGEGEGEASFPTGGEAGEEDAASDEDDEAEQDADMESDEDTSQEGQYAAVDVEVEDAPSTPVSAIFDSTTATESTAPPSQSQESGCEQSPKHHVSEDAEDSKDMTFSTDDAESG